MTIGFTGSVGSVRPPPAFEKLGKRELSRGFRFSILPGLVLRSGRDAKLRYQRCTAQDENRSPNRERSETH